MTRHATIILLCLGGLLCGRTPPRCAQAPSSGSIETRTTETERSDRPTTPVAVPDFDRWARQPNLRCHVPAIRAWRVDRHVRADTRVLPGPAAGSLQILLAQRPGRDGDLSKYSIIYQRTHFDPADAAQWREMAVAFREAFRLSLESGGEFKTVEVGQPMITHVAELQRMFLTYRVETHSGDTISGAYLAAPVRDGILFFNLALQGHGVDALSVPMRNLRLAVNRGLARSAGRMRPYLIGLLLAIPAVVVAVMLYRQRRQAAPAAIRERRSDRRRRARRQS